MSSPPSTLGWLDIHAHFHTPRSPPDHEKAISAMHAQHFLVSPSWQYSNKETLSYLDSAGISVQLLSAIPTSHSDLHASNDYGHSLVAANPHRFGLLAGLPTDSAPESLAEIKRTDAFSPKPDGYAVHTEYAATTLDDRSLDPLWEELDTRKAVVFIHPNAYAEAKLPQPVPLVEAALDTTRVVTAMLYAGVFKRYPGITFVLSHCGGALPVLSGRIGLLGTQSWVPNPEELSRGEIEEQLRRLWVDTAATARTGLRPAVEMVGWERVVYGADCGVPCSTNETMEENREDVKRVERECGRTEGGVGRRGWELFPEAKRRAEKGLR